MNESAILARHISDIDYDDIPRDAVEVTKKSLLDGLGTILAGGGLGEGCRQFVTLAIQAGGREESTIIGYNTRGPACMAAFANGSMAHAIDFEDTHDLAQVHPNAAVIPAALAIAESIGNVSGKDLITALALGSDIVCRLGLALKEDPIKYGWYMPPILGAFGAATAAGKLLGLNQEQILDAHSLTLCQATCSAELTDSPRSMVRAIRDAFSTKAGVLSAQLAGMGITGFNRPIEGNSGFFRLYAREAYDLAILTDKLGTVFEGANVSFKPWPSCRGTHPFIEEALQLLNRYKIKVADIDEILIVMGPSSMHEILCEPLETKRCPVTAIDAKFSIPFTVATALFYGEVALKHFDQQALYNNGVLEIARRITYRVDESLGEKPGFLIVKIGRDEIESEKIEYAYGHPHNPVSQDILISKFMDCAGYSANPVPEHNLRKLVQLILNLEDVKNIGDIMEYL